VNELILFGDVEDAARIFLEEELVSVPVSVTIPPTRPDAFVVVFGVGRSRRDLVTESVMLRADCYSTSESAAHDLSQRVRALLRTLPSQTISTLIVYRHQELSGPVMAPDEVSNQAMYTQTAVIDVRCKSTERMA